MRPKISTLLIYFLLCLIGASTVFPLFWMVMTSFKPPQADVTDMTQLIPRAFDLSSYRYIFAETAFLRVLLNSTFVTLSVTVGKVFTSSLAAYAFARMRFFGRDKIFLGYLMTLMIPGAVTMIPSFLILRKIGWIDTYWALIIPGLFTAYGTFMLRQFFLSLPRDLEEAARIDGCSHWGIYWHVILPLSRNALLTLSIITFMGSWKGLMWPLIVTHSARLYTLPVALSKFNEMDGVQWTVLMAGAVIMTLPMLILFIFGQKMFTKGIMLGAVKG
jgi:multiple sugar transport system permease protein